MGQQDCVTAVQALHLDSAPMMRQSPVCHDLASSRELSIPDETQSMDRTPPAPASTEGSSLQCSEPASPMPIEMMSAKQPQLRTDTKIKDTAFITHALLRKHYKYLLPWLSNQPETPVEEEDPYGSSATSKNCMAGEFHAMSLRIFCDISTAIYDDVRRREEEILPESPQQEPWIRNKQNESRMVLCRTFNEHYVRLVTTVVLEQARRLAEIRIRLHRRYALAKRWDSSPDLG